VTPADRESALAGGHGPQTCSQFHPPSATESRGRASHPGRRPCGRSIVRIAADTTDGADFRRQGYPFQASSIPAAVQRSPSYRQANQRRARFRPNAMSRPTTELGWSLMNSCQRAVAASLRYKAPSTDIAVQQSPSRTRTSASRGSRRSRTSDVVGPRKLVCQATEPPSVRPGPHARALSSNPRRFCHRRAPPHASCCRHRA